MEQSGSSESKSDAAGAMGSLARLVESAEAKKKQEQVCANFESTSSSSSSSSSARRMRLKSSVLSKNTLDESDLNRLACGGGGYSAKAASDAPSDFRDSNKERRKSQTAAPPPPPTQSQRRQTSMTNRPKRTSDNNYDDDDDEDENDCKGASEQEADCNVAQSATVSSSSSSTQTRTQSQSQTQTSNSRSDRNCAIVVVVGKDLADKTKKKTIEVLGEQTKQNESVIRGKRAPQTTTSMQSCRSRQSLGALPCDEQPEVGCKPTTTKTSESDEAERLTRAARRRSVATMSASSQEHNCDNSAQVWAQKQRRQTIGLRLARLERREWRNRLFDELSAARSSRQSLLHVPVVVGGGGSSDRLDRTPEEESVAECAPQSVSVRPTTTTKTAEAADPSGGHKSPYRKAADALQSAMRSVVHRGSEPAQRQPAPIGAACGERRASAYMLPALLLSKARDQRQMHDSDEDDDDDDDEGDDGEDVAGSRRASEPLWCKRDTGESEIKARKWLLGDSATTTKLELDEDVSIELNDSEVEYVDQVNEIDGDYDESYDDDDDEDDDDDVVDEVGGRRTVLRSHFEHRLRASASSPSALATPTAFASSDNSDEGAAGDPMGEGENESELVRLAAENALLARRLFSGAVANKSTCDFRRQVAGTKVEALRSLEPPSTLQLQRDRTPTQCELSTSGVASLVVRANPLERVLTPLSRLQVNCATNATTTPTATTKKRHSIINLLGGGGGGSGHANVQPPPTSQTNAPTSGCGGRRGRARRASAATANNPKPHYFGADALNCPPHLQQECDSSSSQQQQTYDPLIPESGFKIVVMGTSGTGKSCIVRRFLYDTYTRQHAPTVEDTYFVEFPHQKNVINISISDTSGTYQFPAMRKLAINSADAFILVYSVDDPQSFNDLEQLRQSILDEREQAYLEQASNCSTASNASSSTHDCFNDASNASSLTSSGFVSSSSAGAGLSGSGSYQGGSSNAPHLAAAAAAAANQQQQQQQHQELSVSPSSRHWSLASLFSHSHNNCLNQAATNSNQQQQQQQNPFTHLNHPRNQSTCSSICSPSNSCSTSADNSRRSSISAAEAALRTRRTRYPPMVIVANKYDLPSEKHLVNSDETEALVVIDWNNGFVRASAAQNWNIDEIFQQVLRQARQPPSLTEAIASKRRKSLPPKLPT